VRSPIVLDASQSPWPIAPADGIICINMIHISPWNATVRLIKDAAATLSQGSPLYLYGPHKRDRFATAPSNQSIRTESSRSQSKLSSARPGCRRCFEPDIVCLRELKAADIELPAGAILQAGYHGGTARREELERSGHSRAMGSSCDSHGLARRRRRPAMLLSRGCR
jgi:hypothetical protein